MPKKRSVAKGFNKRLQRLYRRVASGPALDPEQLPDEPQTPTTEGAGTPKTHLDIQKLVAAQEKRRRRAVKRLSGSQRS